MCKDDHKPSVETILRRAGLQKTAQRLAVLEILNRVSQPLTAADIFRLMPGEQKVNLVTVYRILASYTARGIIREFESKRGVHYYERVDPDTQPHPHFNCRNCGVMICMSAAPEVWTKLGDEPDFEIESISIRGLCSLCRQQKINLPQRSMKM